MEKSFFSKKALPKTYICSVYFNLFNGIQNKSEQGVEHHKLTETIHHN